ncbi:FAD dependent oxidoreductase-domain-containing protein [Colletotrichum phormii]|uniref:FAD dependent oxidoreductase-domain-containing protein n=1 Tax=Colletotrichum phormii TaxID=359342 RepID=A0AAJ0EBZ9_9PEZI|nr:FAD dependent oxidoreductase-domain-containing protein [Colletotrichum phormii]KAK1624152.1 FAD dependent oxidoreductase-domain-containing protein [Colletotrichum phormii]
MRLIIPFALFLASKSLGQDPGLPVANPTISYWQLPPLEGVADHQSEHLPTDVDVVIIGSGMSGTSIAWHLLKENNSTTPLRVAMIEARQACSGATGRNGGHIRPSSYAEYAGAKSTVSQSEAAKIIRLRSAHVNALISAANSLPEEGRLAAEARVVDSIDAFFDEQRWKTAVDQVKALKEEVPDVRDEWAIFESEEARNISLLPETVGILTGTPKMAGAIWPYRFITHALKSLLGIYPGFTLDTDTAALNISTTAEAADPFNFEVHTSRGSIRTKHVVYATNAWTPHLVPGLQGAIRGGRLHMSECPTWRHLATGRAWSLYRNGLDYIVQMPRNGELMFGADIDGDDANANTYDDSRPPLHLSASYLNGALPNHFGYDTWGSERTDFPPPSDTRVWNGRTKRVWVGIEGGSFDSRPFVGRIPQSITGRSVKSASVGGEWVSASFDGEGMCFCWNRPTLGSRRLLPRSVPATVVRVAQPHEGGIPQTSCRRWHLVRLPQKNNKNKQYHHYSR